MHNFTQHTEIRNTPVDGLDSWTVLKGDQAWDGVLMGWVESNKAVWMAHTRGRKVVVQAGGCLGLYPRLFSQVFEHVYTFEPVPINFHCLVQNTQVENITKFNAGLGPKTGVASISSVNHSNPGLARATLNEEGTARTTMFALDDLNLPGCDLIQLDVEGYELDVLRGAIKTIERFRPAISLERGNDTHLNFLSHWGYTQKATTFDDVVYTTDK